MPRIRFGVAAPAAAGEAATEGTVCAGRNWPAQTGLNEGHESPTSPEPGEETDAR